jgi:hypothetical protein
MDRSIDIDDLWRIAARKLQASPLPPHDLHVEGLRCLASALEGAGRYDAAALRLLHAVGAVDTVAAAASRD